MSSFILCGVSSMQRVRASTLRNGSVRSNTLALLAQAHHRPCRTMYLCRTMSVAGALTFSNRRLHAAGHHVQQRHANLQSQCHARQYCEQRGDIYELSEDEFSSIDEEEAGFDVLQTFSISQLMEQLQDATDHLYCDSTSPFAASATSVEVIRFISGRSSFCSYVSLLLDSLDKKRFCSSGEMAAAFQHVSQVLHGGDADLLSLRQPLIELRSALPKQTTSQAVSSSSDWRSSDCGALDDATLNSSYISWVSGLLERLSSYLDALEAGTLSQHLLEAHSLGLPILIADASGELCAESLMVCEKAPPLIYQEDDGSTWIIMAEFDPGYMGFDTLEHNTVLRAQVYAYVLKLLAGIDRPVFINDEPVVFEGLKRRGGSETPLVHHLDPRPFGPVTLPQSCYEMPVVRHYGQALRDVVRWG